MSKSDETLSRGTTLTKLLGPAKIATLRVLWQAGRRRALEPIMLDPKRSLAVGRTVTSPNVALDDPHASRLHATFRAAEGGAGATLEDHF